MPRRPRRMTPETTLKRQVVSLFKTLGIFSYHLMGGMGSYPGAPDRVVHHEGEVVYIEFKSPGGRLSEHQVKFQKQCERDNIHYIVARSVEDVVENMGLKVLI